MNEVIADEGSERAVLGIMLADPGSHHEAGMLLGEDDFSVPSHRILHSHIVELGNSVGPQTLVGSLTTKRKLDAVGGAMVVMDLYTEATGKEHLEFYAAKLVEARVRRGAVAVARHVINEAVMGETEPAAIVAEGVTKLGMLSQGRTELPDIRRQLLETVERIDAESSGQVEPGLNLRWDSMRTRVPMRAGSYTVVGGKTSSGKSVLAGNMAVDVVGDAKGVAVFSYEMSSDELLRRMISDHGKIEANKLFSPLHNKMGHADMDGMIRAQQQFSAANLHIFDDPTIGVSKLASLCRIMHAADPLSLIVVDYIQLIPMTIKGASREVQVATISRELRRLAGELKVAVVALTQLNENGDVRESRAIIQDAEILLNIDEDVLWVEKQRHGQKNFHLNIELAPNTLAFRETG